MDRQDLEDVLALRAMARAARERFEGRFGGSVAARAVSADFDEIVYRLDAMYRRFELTSPRVRDRMTASVRELLEKVPR